MVSPNALLARSANPTQRVDLGIQPRNVNFYSKLALPTWKPKVVNGKSRNFLKRKRRSWLRRKRRRARTLRGNSFGTLTMKAQGDAMREVEEVERSYVMVGAWTLGLSNHAALDSSRVVVDTPGLVQTKDHSRKRSSSPKPVCTFYPCAVIYHSHCSSFSPSEISGVPKIL